MQIHLFTFLCPYKDINECQDDKPCGENTVCTNTNGSYYCQCKDGFRNPTGKVNFTVGACKGKSSQIYCDNNSVVDIQECLEIKDICGSNAKCKNAVPYYSCTCDDGFISTTGNKTFHHDQNATCEDINECQKGNPCGQSASCYNTQGSYYLYFTPSSSLLLFSDFLDLVGNALRLIGSFTNSSRIYISSTQTELDMFVHKGPDIPKGNITLSTKHANLDIQMEIAAGDPAYYPGFTTVSLMSYSNLENSTDGFFNGMKPQENQSFKINSKVATVTVSNRNTSHLKTPTNQTFHICVFWDSSVNGGSWSDRGCGVAESNLEYTSCSCNHLGTFAILTAHNEIKEKFEFHLIIWVFLSLSLICLFISILTFSMIHSIKSLRTTIHLHLCISLFIANLAFLAGISHFENQDSCTVVTGILHFSYLATFLWICLDSVQLFRMIMLVSNTNFKTLHMMAAAYGVPAVIVAISTLANSMGHGTERYCWVTQGFIWNYFGPACVIIIVNIFFFFITVWKLAQKFSSVNPDLDDLHKIEAFTISAVAQLFVLGNTWIFGSFQFQENHTAMAYLTIFGSLEGVTLFAVYCLFSRQVSNIHVSKSAQDTRECQL
uniref:EGF-like module-containing mucin-like hormone receptor-like 1-like n=1 Tax=Neolamprologus brichardi TaxID=32507 RepID=A0A3Q4N418_NEOBR